MRLFSAEWQDRQGMANWKGWRRINAFEDSISEFLWSDWVKPRNITQIVDVPVEIRTKHVPGVCQKRYRLSQRDRLRMALAWRGTICNYLGSRETRSQIWTSIFHVGFGVPTTMLMKSYIMYIIHNLMQYNDMFKVQHKKSTVSFFLAGVLRRAARRFSPTFRKNVLNSLI